MEIKYNPYLRKTDMWINGAEIKENEFLTSIQERKLEIWVEKKKLPKLTLRHKAPTYCIWRWYKDVDFIPRSSHQGYLSG